MKGSPVFIGAVLLAVAMLFVIYTGSTVTNVFAVAKASGVPPAPETVQTIATHKLAAEGTGVLVLLFALWVMASVRRANVRRMALLATVGVALEALFGATEGPLGLTLGTFHAFLAPVLFSLIAAIAALTWPGWDEAPETIKEKGWPSIRGLARTTTVLLVLQVLLGAAFRHEVAGVLWHILGAFLAVLFGIALVVFITQMSESSPLRPPVIVLTVFLGVQVTLGIVLISISDPSKHPMFSMIATAAHVLVGACTLACAVIAAMLVYRGVEPASTP
jgi:heme A synthase